jgi:metal-sulfur cluster biosynthetic enzyme
VRQALRGVTDPELDQSVVDLEFVRRITVEGGRVAVDFRLPTFWCSANFAWIMAEDMRDAVAALPWAEGVTVELVDHFAAERVNSGIAEGTTFGAAFDTVGDPDLAALRETFRRKAYLGRMSATIEELKRAGWAAEMIVALTVSELRSLDAGPDAAAAISRFLELRQGGGRATGGSDPAFRKADGTPIAPAELGAFLRDIRMARRGAEANGEMCKALLRARLEAASQASLHFC